MAKLRVTVSVGSVRWRGQEAELPGTTAHSGGRKRGREQAGNRLPGGRNEGSRAIALRIDGDVGVATGFSMSVSRPSYGRAKTLDGNAPLWQDTRESPSSRFLPQESLKGKSWFNPGLAFVFCGVPLPKHKRKSRTCCRLRAMCSYHTFAAGENLNYLGHRKQEVNSHISH